MINYCVKIGFHPPHLSIAGALAGEHVEIVGGMMERRIRRHRLLTVAQAPVGGDNGGQTS